MAVTNNDGMYSYLDQLSTQELEDLLQKDMETADGGDPDMVMYILEVIEKREGGADKEAATTALKDFFSTYATAEGEGLQLYPSNSSDHINAPLKSRKPLHKGKAPKTIFRKSLLVAATLACVFVLAACSFGGLARFFQMVGKWTSEVFTFENAYKGDIPQGVRTEENQPSENVQYDKIEEALAAYGITEKVVPVFPEDYEIVAVNVSSPEYSDHINFSTLYQENDRYIVFQVIYFTQAHAFDFEKDDTVVTEYQQGDLTYYFYQNNNSNCVTWFNNNLECFIDTNASKDTLVSMITSLQ